MSILEDGIDGRIGARVRALRAEAGLTLEALAERAEVSRAMLSRIERGSSSPTAQLLNKVCGGLGITLSALFAAAERPVSPLARRADQPVWRDPASGYVRRNVSPPGSGSAVEIVEVEFPGRAEVGFDNRRVAGADQHVWVLEGALELTLGEAVFQLAAGDCLAMGFDRPVRFRNLATRPLRYAVVISRREIRP